MIEADKAARKAKFGGVQEQPTPAPAPAKVAAPVAVQPKDYLQTKLQVGLIILKLLSIKQLKVKTPQVLVFLYS